MVRYTYDCVGCGLPCMGKSCSYYRIANRYCDKCGRRTDELYEHEEGEFCEECIIQEEEDIDDSGESEI